MTTEGHPDNHIAVAVIGAGGAGLTAGLAAAESGATVCIFEASDVVGGTYAYSAGQVWAVATREEAAAGIADSLEEGARHVRRLSAGRHDDAILATYLADLPDTLEWLADVHGFVHELLVGFPDYYAEDEGGKFSGRYLAPLTFDRSSLPDQWRDRLVQAPMYARIPATYGEVISWGGFGRAAEWDWTELDARAGRGLVGFGAAAAGYLLAAALRAGAGVELEHRLTGLQRESDGWRLTFATPEGEEQVLADNVILASGGYEQSASLQSSLDSKPAVAGVGLPTVNGEPVRLALAAGAAFETVAGQILIPTLAIPGEQYRGAQVYRLATREMALPGGIVVDRSGSRFSDESFYRHVAAEMVRLDPVTQTYPHADAFLVFDDAARDQYMLGPVAPGERPEWLASAASPEALAQRIGVDPAGLSGAIARFNADAANGVDSQFNRGDRAFGRASGDRDNLPSPVLRPLRGEYFAIPIHVTTVGSSGGLLFDVDGRVLDWFHEPIDGLYAVGNTAAGLVEGQWYNSGVANGRALVFGRRAARHAAQRIATSSARV